MAPGLGRYAPKEIAGQDLAGYPTWDWLRMDQVDWYYDTSTSLERRFGRRIPSLMFIHIPLWEHRFMWFGSVDGRTDADHARGKARHRIVRERNKDECPGPFNSGLFSAVQHRGDVKGIFCGHDHVNTYAGNYYGVLADTTMRFASELGIDLAADDQWMEPLPLPADKG